MSIFDTALRGSSGSFIALVMHLQHKYEKLESSHLKIFTRYCGVKNIEYLAQYKYKYNVISVGKICPTSHRFIANFSACPVLFTIFNERGGLILDDIVQIKER